jgi:hypothetical protein
MQVGGRRAGPAVRVLLQAQAPQPELHIPTRTIQRAHRQPAERGSGAGACALACEDGTAGADEHGIDSTRVNHDMLLIINKDYILPLSTVSAGAMLYC